MADNIDTAKKGNQGGILKYNEEGTSKIDIRLTETDIPGASLDGCDPRKLTVKQLKFWLSCRGAKTTGNKKELVGRVNNYNNIPELRDNIVDPDPDKLFTKAKLEDDGILRDSNVVPSESSFPSDNTFSDDLTVLPSFNPGDLYNLVKKSGKNIRKYSHLPVVDKAIDKGFFMKNLVHDLQTSTQETNKNVVYVRALCWASMSKSVEYKVKLKIHCVGEQKIAEAQCDKKCPASKSGCCSHVMATIWLLDEYSRQNLTSAPQTKSKTSKPQAWGIPNQKRVVVHHPIMETQLQQPKHVSNINKNRRQGIVSTLFDPRPPKRRCLDVDGLKIMGKKLENIKIPYSKLIPDGPIQTTKIEIGVVAKGSALDIQISGVEAKDTGDDKLAACKSMYPSLPLQSIGDMKLNGDISEVKMTLAESHEIFKNTTGQSTNPLWMKQRKTRLTASKFGKIVKRKKDYSDSFAKSICNPVDISHLPYVKYGIENEGRVTELYKEAMHKEGKNVELFEVGLCINPSLPHLGASLDRGVYDPTEPCGNQYGGLEVKTCPKAGSLQLSICQTVGHPDFKGHNFLEKLGNDIVINVNHEYYFQTQGQLALTALPWVDFVAYSGIGEIFKQRIILDKELWETKILPKLNAFYFQYKYLFVAQ